MSTQLQKRLIPLFYYALNTQGFLFLGSSESIGEFTDIFAPIDRKSKIYRSLDTTQHLRHATIMRTMPLSHDTVMTNHLSEKKSDDHSIKVKELTESTLLRHYTPTSILVNEHADILYLHGRTGLYLEPAPGAVCMNVLKMAREGLQRELTIALHKAFMQKIEVKKQDLQVKTNGDYTSVDLIVRPLNKANNSNHADLNLALIVFIESSPSLSPKNHELEISSSINKNVSVENMDNNRLIAQLQHELKTKEEYLQSTNEELETANEELKSANEELQSVNEELQSTNEELETSKEELQSVNEELTTVNTELQQKVSDLSDVNNDMNNLLAGTGIGTVFVDHHLCIKRFTPAVTQIINLIQTDIGRPVAHTVTNIMNYHTLIEDIQAVLDTLIQKDIEVQTKDKGWYLLRIRPYRTLENVIEGAVMSFFDITKIKHTQAELEKSNELCRMAVMVRDAANAIIVHDLQGTILLWNGAAERMYGWHESEALSKNINEFIPVSEREKEEAMKRNVLTNKTITQYPSQRLTKQDTIIPVTITIFALVNQASSLYAYATLEQQLVDQGDKS